MIVCEGFIKHNIYIIYNMDKVPENVVNKKLYLKAISIVYPKYKRPSLYRSMALQKEYMELGGKYKGDKPKKGGEGKKWLSEKWIQVVPFLESGERIKCGEGKDSKGCRPTVRVDARTPITISELIEKHGKSKLLKFAKKKKANMDLRANWKELKFK